ncbi:DUF6990 domain-containing protein [Sinorhizobium meliloti]|uniref:DUF6990 domain-containing protein n=1 Tax=Rhizobium meliloti TaxID=382 RepID=UPI0003664859|nr:hypothetical protein [Sinorhizobium meliloti]ARS69609.1 hypothetical protein SMRU11_21080 [Sinorhizobium meliloti RU11/001]ASP68241.1 hypothetical protein CDO29_27705 [Sinorhizobium meliloti]MDE3767271.1 hypothetical protein [Sinorhizobium meliloti]MDE3780101.1 hypothetical protein [Sinorhizobium meliloti]MDE3785308.1 hypothetical protein [Sinorhizobium meliloti]
MNTFEKKALAEFKLLGWTASREKQSGDAVLSMDEGDNELQAVLQIRQLLCDQTMYFGISSGLKSYTSIFGRIAGIKQTHMWLLQNCVKRRAAEISRKEIEMVSREAIEWWQAQDNFTEVKALSGPPPDNGQSQLKHLTALAYLGDFSTLMDYQEIFRRGKRLNFVPMIKPEMIDRAIDIALEKA